MGLLRVGLKIKSDGRMMSWGRIARNETLGRRRRHQYSLLGNNDGIAEGWSEDKGRWRHDELRMFRKETIQWTEDANTHCLAESMGLMRVGLSVETNMLDYDFDS